MIENTWVNLMLKVILVSFLVIPLIVRLEAKLVLGIATSKVGADAGTSSIVPEVCLLLALL